MFFTKAITLGAVATFSLIGNVFAADAILQTFQDSNCEIFADEHLEITANSANRLGQSALSFRGNFQDDSRSCFVISLTDPNCNEGPHDQVVSLALQENISDCETVAFPSNCLVIKCFD